MTGGTLKIVFTGEDLARVRIASRIDELWEMAMSLHVLQKPGGGKDMTDWRRQARADLAATGLLKLVRQTLVPLMPIKAYFPDFLTPHQAQVGPQNGIDALADTPPSRVRREVDQLRGHAALPATLDDLARGNQRAITGLASLAARYCQTAFASHRTTMEHALGRERARLTRLLGDHGVEAMLAALGPRMRWRPPILEADYAAGQYEIQLRGRGLTLIPSYFCRYTPVALADPSLPPVLIFPAPRRTPASDPGPNPGPDDGLPDLLGTTRARILRCVAATTGCTTSELARRTGTSLSSASAHAQVLHRTGLITSTRHANMVIHQITRLGSDLIRYQTPP
ncbi:ArsR/SmtB family transcription factor [Nonomuraea turcica]|uniref:ArsR/SmtB family transcription factor n=1 Tax=Nonomuraea sp. G32 TaxID=3067274 RepID=UPI00273C6E5C|nr:MarR family transcriptional regulator [Nonomuraea sp. G32]MDP4512075.1 helix-turn-helix domain-containing protein [Nonomuraea sp. G32]